MYFEPEATAEVFKFVIFILIRIIGIELSLTDPGAQVINIGC